MIDFAEPPQPSSPLRSAARFWPVTAILIALGLAAGFAAASRHAATYTAEARVAVGGQDLSSQAIPGFAQASQALAADFARYVSLPQQGPAIEKGLPGGISQVLSLSASPVPSSNIISIEATSHRPDVAVAAVRLAMNALMTAVNNPAKATLPARLLTQYQAMAAQVAQASVTLDAAKQHLAVLTADKTSTDADIAAARAAVVAAGSAYDGLKIQQSALGNRYQAAATSTAPSSDLSIIQQASVIFDNKRSSKDKFALAGAGAGALLALVIAALLARMRPKRSSRAPHRRTEETQHASPGRRTTGSGSEDNDWSDDATTRMRAPTTASGRVGDPRRM
ncbi:MAG: hypothetical protein QOJ62_986 [Actinomycetota bacterium]|nr:hypothetical protein [Actinomycetota bacterium]